MRGSEADVEESTKVIHYFTLMELSEIGDLLMAVCVGSFARMSLCP